MKIHVLNCLESCTARLFRSERDGANAVLDVDLRDISFSPDRRFAVAKLHYGTLFIAVRVDEEESTSLSGEYVDCFSYALDDPMLTKLWIEWDCIAYGFCKLVLWAPEKANEFGGSFERTLHRFYFDRNLYERKKNELHPAPL